MSSSGIYPLATVFRANATNYIRCRMAAPDGTGAVTGVDGEGKWLKIADFTGSITRNIYNLSAAAPTTVVETATVTVATAIQDSPVTSTADWDVDSTGWNFKDTIEADVMTSRGGQYRVVYSGTVTGDSNASILAELVGPAE